MRQSTALTFAARCVYGLEWIVAGEIQGMLRPIHLMLGHRTIQFTTSGIPDGVSLRLGSADDVFVVAGEVAGVDHTRAVLGKVGESVRDLDLSGALDIVRAVRRSTLDRRFTVGASFLGARRYNRYELEDAVAQGIASFSGMTYTPTREVDALDTDILTIRVHIADGRALVMVRLFERPIHRRTYKQVSVTGTLHPPVAYAMAMLAGLDVGVQLLDPCCGGGTILIEAGRLQPTIRLRGFDLDPARAAAGRTNAGLAGLDVACEVGDVTRLPCDSGSIDRIISNLPWGIETEAGGGLSAGGPDALFHELARILRPNGRMVLLLGGRLCDLEAPKRAGLSVVHRQRLSLFGQHPELWIVRSFTSSDRMFAPDAPFGRELERAIALVDGAFLADDAKRVRAQS